MPSRPPGSAPFNFRTCRTWLVCIGSIEAAWLVVRGAGRRGAFHDEDTLTVLAEEVRRDLQEQVQRGWYYLHPGADPYRPTVKGAFLMTLGQMWPVKPLRELARWRRERGVLA